MCVLKASHPLQTDAKEIQMTWPEVRILITQLEGSSAYLIAKQNANVSNPRSCQERKNKLHNLLGKQPLQSLHFPGLAFFPEFLFL